MGKLETRRKTDEPAGGSLLRPMSLGHHGFSLDFLSSMTIMAYVLAGCPGPKATVEVDAACDAVSFRGKC